MDTLRFSPFFTLARPYLGALWLLAALAACGGGGQPTGPVDPDPPDPPVTEPQDGRVLLLNETAYAVESAYLYRRAPNAPAIVRQTVAAGQQGEISAGILPGGLEIEFDLVLVLPPEVGFRVRRKATARIDGEVRLRVYQPEADDPFSSLIEQSTD